MKIKIKRAYDPAAKGDGFRILVERLWPRGVSKAQARIDLWTKAAAPSTQLRRWYDHDPERWGEFKRRYYAELKASEEAALALDEIIARARKGPVTFVFGSKEPELNSAAALRDYVKSRP